MIEPGDEVIAVRHGGRDTNGLPIARPEQGQIYRIGKIYAMKYGLGCTLEGMDPKPYKGYLLYVVEGCALGAKAGWYFEKVRRQVPLDGVME